MSEINIWKIFVNEGKEYWSDYIDKIFQRAYKRNNGTPHGTPEDWDLHWRIMDEINIACLEVIEDDQQLDFDF